MVNAILGVLLTPWFLNTDQYIFCMQTLIWVIGIPIIFCAILLIASLFRSMLESSKDNHDILLIP